MPDTPAASGNPFIDFTDAHLKAAMRRALRLVMVITAIAFITLLITMGWQTAMLLLAGALVSASGLWEWQKLIGVINTHMDQAAGASASITSDGHSGQEPRPGAQPTAGTGRVVAGFLLRLIVAGLVLYGSLRCFQGSVYALIAGLMLAVVALGIEAVRLVRN